MRQGVPVFLRHQGAAIAATAIDFACMAVLVELGLLGPVAATATGAATGALVNFLLARRLVFFSAGTPLTGQMLRYALVSLGSLALNSGGEALLHGRLGLQYLVARVIVAITVSVAWNYPLHRHLVFRRPPGAP